MGRLGAAPAVLLLLLAASSSSQALRQSPLEAISELGKRNDYDYAVALDAEQGSPGMSWLDAEQLAIDPSYAEAAAGDEPGMHPQPPNSVAEPVSAAGPGVPWQAVARLQAVVEAANIAAAQLLSQGMLRESAGELQDAAEPEADALDEAYAEAYYVAEASEDQQLDDHELAEYELILAQPGEAPLHLASRAAALEGLAASLVLTSGERPAVQRDASALDAVLTFEEEQGAEAEELAAEYEAYADADDMAAPSDYYEFWSADNQRPPLHGPLALGLASRAWLTRAAGSLASALPDAEDFASQMPALLFAAATLGICAAFLHALLSLRAALAEADASAAAAGGSGLARGRASRRASSKSLNMPLLPDAVWDEEVAATELQAASAAQSFVTVQSFVNPLRTYQGYRQLPGKQ